MSQSPFSSWQAGSPSKRVSGLRLLTPDAIIQRIRKGTNPPHWQIFFGRGTYVGAWKLVLMAFLCGFLGLVFASALNPGAHTCIDCSSGSNNSLDVFPIVFFGLAVAFLIAAIRREIAESSGKKRMFLVVLSDGAFQCNDTRDMWQCRCIYFDQVAKMHVQFESRLLSWSHRLENTAGDWVVYANLNNGRVERWEIDPRIGECSHICRSIMWAFENYRIH